MLDAISNTAEALLSWTDIIILLVIILLPFGISLLIRIFTFKLKADYIARRIADEVGNMLEEMEWHTNTDTNPDNTLDEYEE